MTDDLLIASFLPALAVESWELDEVDKHEYSSFGRALHTGSWDNCIPVIWPWDCICN